MCKIKDPGPLLFTKGHRLRSNEDPDLKPAVMVLHCEPSLQIYLSPGFTIALYPLGSMAGVWALPLERLRSIIIPDGAAESEDGLWKPSLIIITQIMSAWIVNDTRLRPY